ncbi:MAG TPA: 50S ribosomal protein L20 [Candidatus Omnitrophota bacterium]|nr:50S ribosomal protein L20 [Candidatus Omnitrophota bacterium]
MVRVRSVLASKRRKKRVLKKAKGQFGHRHSRYQQAKRSVVKGMAYSYRDRKVKKRDFRALWIVRINAACREEGVTYSQFMSGLKRANVGLDRKALADLAISSPSAFKKLVKVSQDASSGKSAKKEKKTKTASA